VTSLRHQQLALRMDLLRYGQLGGRSPAFGVVDWHMEPNGGLPIPVA
jgi:hypothetical protein